MQRLPQHPDHARCLRSRSDVVVYLLRHIHYYRRIFPKSGVREALLEYGVDIPESTITRKKREAGLVNPSRAGSTASAYQKLLVVMNTLLGSVTEDLCLGNICSHPDEPYISRNQVLRGKELQNRIVESHFMEISLAELEKIRSTLSIELHPSIQLHSQWIFTLLRHDPDSGIFVYAVMECKTNCILGTWAFSSPLSPLSILHCILTVAKSVGGLPNSVNCTALDDILHTILSIAMSRGSPLALHPGRGVGNLLSSLDASKWPAYDKYDGVQRLLANWLWAQDFCCLYNLLPVSVCANDLNQATSPLCDAQAVQQRCTWMTRLQENGFHSHLTLIDPAFFDEILTALRSRYQDCLNEILFNDKATSIYSQPDVVQGDYTGSLGGIYSRMLPFMLKHCSEYPLH